MYGLLLITHVHNMLATLSASTLARSFPWKVVLLSFLKVSSQQIIASSSLLSPSNSSFSSSSISIKIVGAPASVWSALDTWEKCNNSRIDVPDIPARAFVVNGEHDTINSTGSIRMNVGAIGYHEMHGPTLLNQTRSCHTSWNATLDPDPSMFAGNEFLDSTVRFDNGTVIALVHTSKYNFPEEIESILVASYL
jgi:hypothetical protein